jgi:hypothetical protein
VALAVLDLLRRIVAARPAAFGGLDRLAVDHPRREAVSKVMPARSGSASGGLRRCRSRSPRFAPGAHNLRQATIETEPREAALDDPCQPSDRKNTLPALEDPQLPAIAPELAGELAALVAIEAANAPFSLVLTDWPSMMATVGPGFRCKRHPDYASSSAMVTIPSACESAIQVRHACSLRASATRASDLEGATGEVMVLLQKSQHTDFKQLFDVRNWLRMVRNQERHWRGDGEVGSPDLPAGETADGAPLDGHRHGHRDRFVRGRSRSPCRGRGSVVWTGRDANGRARCCPATPA